jgi:mevalonate kinase
MTRSITATIPGKIMLCGEYAVLRGGRALASTVSYKMRAILNAQESESSSEWTLCSDLWDEPRTIHTDACFDAAAESFEPFEQVVRQAASKCDRPLSGRVELQSDLDPRLGMGSSSALRLGVLSTMSMLGGSTFDCWSVAKQAHELQRLCQGKSSGYDSATQLLGGLVQFQCPDQQNWPGNVSKLSGATDVLNRFIRICAGGSGSVTGAAVGSVSSWLSSRNLWSELEQVSEQLVDAFLLLVERPNDEAISNVMQNIKAHRKIFSAAPNFPHAVFSKLSQHDGFDQTWTAKTTGAGGEDSILIVGTEAGLLQAEAAIQSVNWQVLPARFVEAGLNVEVLP